MTYQPGDFVFDRSTGRTMVVLETAGSTIRCSSVWGHRYKLREFHTSEVGSVVVEMCRQIDVRDQLRAEARAKAKQEEISVRLARQLEKKSTANEDK